MLRSMQTWALTLAVLALAGGTAQAQVFGQPQTRYQPYPRANLNPTLNLLRGGDPATNYYLGTIPQRAQRQANQQFLSSLNRLSMEQLQQQEAAQQPQFYVPLRGTGHPATFQNYGGYYQFRNSVRLGVPSMGAYAPGGTGRTGR